MRKSKEGKNFSTSNKEIKVSRIFEGEQNWELQKWKNNDINCDYLGKSVLFGFSLV